MAVKIFKVLFSKGYLWLLKTSLFSLVDPPIENSEIRIYLSSKKTLTYVDYSAYICVKKCLFVQVICGRCFIGVIKLDCCI